MLKKIIALTLIFIIMLSNIVVADVVAPNGTAFPYLHTWKNTAGTVQYSAYGRQSMTETGDRYTFEWDCLYTGTTLTSNSGGFQTVYKSNSVCYEYTVTLAYWIDTHYKPTWAEVDAARIADEEQLGYEADINSAVIGLTGGGWLSVVDYVLDWVGQQIDHIDMQADLGTEIPVESSLNFALEIKSLFDAIYSPESYAIDEENGIDDTWKSDGNYDMYIQQVDTSTTFPKDYHVIVCEHDSGFYCITIPASVSKNAENHYIMTTEIPNDILPSDRGEHKCTVKATIMSSESHEEAKNNQTITNNEPIDETVEPIATGHYVTGTNEEIIDARLGEDYIIPATVEISKPTEGESIATGIGIGIPYEIIIRNAKMSSELIIEVVRDIEGTEEIVKTETIEVDAIGTCPLSGIIYSDIAENGYVLRARYIYSDGTGAGTGTAEVSESVTINGTGSGTAGGQDITGANEIIWFAEPIEGNIYEEKPTQYKLGADKSRFGVPYLGSYSINEETHMPEDNASGILTPIAFHESEFIMMNLWINGKVKLPLLSHDEAYNEKIATIYPQDVISGTNVMIITTYFNQGYKDDYYSVLLNGRYYHVWAATEFYYKTVDGGYDGGQIDNTGAPKREDYSDDIWGAVSWGFDSIIYYITFPFKLIGDGIAYVIDLFGTAFGWVGQISSLIASWFSFIPVPLMALIYGTITCTFIAFIIKLFRG